VRIVIEQPLISRIENALLSARIRDEKVEYIELTRKEWNELCDPKSHCSHLISLGDLDDLDSGFKLLGHNLRVVK
jgi:hypothetical protein